MGKQTINPGLSKQDKVALVRDVMIRFPDWKRFGYNRKIIGIIEERTADKKGKNGIVLTDQDITRCIQFIEEQWKEERVVKYSKEKIVDLLTGLYEAKGAKHSDKRMVLQDIAKLEGHYKLDININTANIPEEKASKLKEIFGDREKKKKDDNND